MARAKTLPLDEPRAYDRGQRRLPDGSIFLSAGRIDFVGHPGEPFILTPDTGRAGNLAAFCAALAP
jgi:hypothetical protein